MNFKEAFKEMKSGLAVKLPSWSGYWWWDEEAQTILMYTKDGSCLDIRETQRVEYTIQNILSDEWIYADGMDGATVSVKAYGDNDTFGYWSDDTNIVRFGY